MSWNFILEILLWNMIWLCCEIWSKDINLVSPPAIAVTHLRYCRCGAHHLFFWPSPDQLGYIGSEIHINWAKNDEAQKSLKQHWNRPLFLKSAFPHLIIPTNNCFSHSRFSLGPPSPLGKSWPHDKFDQFHSRRSMPETIRAVCRDIGCAVYVPLTEVLYEVHVCHKQMCCCLCVPLEEVVFVCH